MSTLKLQQRILYREHTGGLQEGVVTEFSKSKTYVKIGPAWHSVSHITLVEELPSPTETALPEEKPVKVVFDYPPGIVEPVEELRAALRTPRRGPAPEANQGTSQAS